MENYISKVKAKCGVDGCEEKFYARLDWVKHCKKAHPKYYKQKLGDCGPCGITECSTKHSDECLSVNAKPIKEP